MDEFKQMLDNQDEIFYEIQVSSSRDVMWIHSSLGETVGRFGKMGIDIHNTIESQLKGESQCLFCTHTKTNYKDWLLFIDKAFELWSVVVDKNLLDFQENTDTDTLRFEAPVGARMHRYFRGVTLTEITDDNLWYNGDLRKWEPLHSSPNANYSTHAPCKTLRAFKRMLRKNPQIIGKCCLVSKYKGHDVYA